MRAVPNVGIGKGPGIFDADKEIAFKFGHHIAQEKIKRQPASE